MDKELDLARRSKVIGWLKSEVAEQVAKVFKGSWEGNQSKISDALASLVVCSYILGGRCGITYHSLDDSIAEKLKKHKAEGHQLEEWYQDISKLEDHFRKR